MKKVTVFFAAAISLWFGCNSNKPSQPNKIPIAITSPIRNADVSDSVNISIAVGDDYTFDRVDFYIDGDSIYSDISLPYSFKWYTGIYLDNSHHVLKAIAYGSEAYQSDTVGVSVIIPGGPLLIVKPKSGAIVRDSVRIIAREAAAYTFPKVTFYVNDDSVAFDSTTTDTIIGVPTRIFSFTLDAHDYPDNSNLRLTAKGVFNSIVYQSSPETIYTAFDYLPDTLEYLMSYSTAAPALRVASEGGHLYIATGGNAVLGVNVANPGSPSPDFTMPSPGQATGLDIDYPYLVVAYGDQGVKRYDISNPSAIRSAGVLNTPGLSWNVKILGNLLFVADNDAVQIVSIHNDALTQLATEAMTGGQAKDVDAAGNIVMAVDNSGVSLIDISSPAAPVARSRYTGLTGRGQCVAIIDTFAFVGTTAELVKLSISNPDTIRFISRQISQTGITGVFATDSVVFVSMGTSSGGAMAIDYRSAAAMTTINQFINGDNCHDICAFGPYVFLAGQTKVDILRFIR